MNISLADLRYAKGVAIPIVDAVYARYDGQGVEVPGIEHLADIHADTGKMKILEATADAQTRILIAATFAGGSLFGAIDRDTVTKTGVVAFRGTRKYQEWIDDFLFPPVHFTEVGGKVPRVHAGFHKVYGLARKSLMDQIHLLNGMDRIIVTGHSLGAAVASLCALDIVNQRLAQDVRSWTFASPRTCFWKPKRFNQEVTQSLRVYNPVDVVTHIPSAVQGYFHVAGGFHIDAKHTGFHSLDLTYAPGLQKKIDEASAQSFVPETSEDEQVEDMLAAPQPETSLAP